MAVPFFKSYQVFLWVFLWLVPYGVPFPRCYDLFLWVFLWLLPEGVPFPRSYKYSYEYFVSALGKFLFQQVSRYSYAYSYGERMG